MKERASAALRIARILETLADADRSAVAFDVWRTYGQTDVPRIPGPYVPRRLGPSQDVRRAALLKDRVLRLSIRKRDGDRCRYCGITVNWLDRRSPSGATYDHVDPAGGNDLENVVVACHHCNVVKNVRTLEQAKMHLLPPPEHPELLLPELERELDPELTLESDHSTDQTPVYVVPEVASNGSKASKKQTYRAEALEILRFLNEKTGKSFREVDANLSFIQARLNSGASIEDCRGLIARKYREWKDDPYYKRFLRPETLFNKTKFESYLGEREAPAP